MQPRRPWIEIGGRTLGLARNGTHDLTDELIRTDFNTDRRPWITIGGRNIMGRTVLNQNFNALKGKNRLPITVGKSGIVFVSVGVGEWKGVGNVVLE